ncbi:MAG TPA: HAD family phosphatase [Candidatus Cloacimonadota bacterium]|nr:HAD family phosphatase [Candidatus Cloacimonadota bacterium]
MKNPLAIIFDMDGVILDSEPIYKIIQDEFFRELGFHVSDREYDRFIGLGLERMWQIIKSERPLALPIGELIERNNARIHNHFLQIVQLDPMPELLEFLQECRRYNFRIALASSTAKSVIMIILNKLGISEFFDEIVSGEEVAVGKPAPDIFLEAARRLQIPARNCVVIEDSENGVKAAKAAGMFCLGFQNPNSGRMNLENADLVMQNFSQIRTYFQA